MGDLSFTASAEPWWPYLFILLAGWLPTDVWRYLGVLSAGKLDEHSPFAALSRTVATSLVAAVIAQIVLYPTGSLASVPLLVRVGALAAGFATYIVAGRRILAGIVVAEAMLIGPALLL